METYFALRRSASTAGLAAFIFFQTHQAANIVTPVVKTRTPAEMRRCCVV